MDRFARFRGEARRAILFLQANGLRTTLAAVLARFRPRHGRSIYDQADFAHEEVERISLNAETTVRRIARQSHMRVYATGSDGGYHKFGTQWWTNPACPWAYQYPALDGLYARQYFDQEGHPNRERARSLYEYMQETFRALFGAPFRSVLEIGSGGGEITREFADAGLDFVSVEGTVGGTEKLAEAGIGGDRVIHADIKFMGSLGRRFDVVMCTEVAEHIEPWFASQLVRCCCDHSGVVWFSAADGKAPPHYHHINEAPIGAWDNIFAQYGHDAFVELDGREGRADRLYLDSEAFEALRLRSNGHA